MAVSLVSTGITFPDATTQTTAASAVTAGNGISVSSGTVAVACPTFNTIGSYVCAYGGSQGTTSNSLSSGSNYSAGSGASQISSGGVSYGGPCASAGFNITNNLSGTWKWMSAFTAGYGGVGVACRVS